MSVATSVACNFFSSKRYQLLRSKLSLGSIPWKVPPKLRLWTSWGLTLQRVRRTYPSFIYGSAPPGADSFSDRHIFCVPKVSAYQSPTVSKWQGWLSGWLIPRPSRSIGFGDVSETNDTLNVIALFVSDYVTRKRLTEEKYRGPGTGQSSPNLLRKDHGLLLWIRQLVIEIVIKPYPRKAQNRLLISLLSKFKVIHDKIPDK